MHGTVGECKPVVQKTHFSLAVEEKDPLGERCTAWWLSADQQIYQHHVQDSFLLADDPPEVAQHCTPSSQLEPVVLEICAGCGEGADCLSKALGATEVHCVDVSEISKSLISRNLPDAKYHHDVRKFDPDKFMQDLFAKFSAFLLVILIGSPCQSHLNDGAGWLQWPSDLIWCIWYIVFKMNMALRTHTDRIALLYEDVYVMCAWNRRIWARMFGVPIFSMDSRVSGLCDRQRLFGSSVDLSGELVSKRPTPNSIIPPGWTRLFSKGYWCSPLASWDEGRTVSHYVCEEWLIADDAGVSMAWVDAELAKMNLCAEGLSRSTLERTWDNKRLLKFKRAYESNPEWWSRLMLPNNYMRDLVMGSPPYRRHCDASGATVSFDLQGQGFCMYGFKTIAKAFAAGAYNRWRLKMPLPGELAGLLFSFSWRHITQDQSAAWLDKKLTTIAEVDLRVPVCRAVCAHVLCGCHMNITGNVLTNEFAGVCSCGKYWNIKGVWHYGFNTVRFEAESVEKLSPRMVQALLAESRC